MADHRLANIFGHLHRHARIIQAHQPHIRRQLQAQQRIDPGANIEHALQPARTLLINELLRRRPHNGDIGLWRAGHPNRNFGVR